MICFREKHKKKRKSSYKTLLVIHSHEEQTRCVNIIPFRVTMSNVNITFYDWKNLYTSYGRIVIDMETFGIYEPIQIIKIIKDRVDPERVLISARYDIAILYKLHLISLLLPIDIVGQVIYFLSFVKSIKIDFCEEIDLFIPK